MKIIFRLATIGLLGSAFLFSAFLFSCKPENVDPLIISRGEYFPLEDGTSWEYLHQHFTLEDSSMSGSSIVRLMVKGDTTIFDKTYKKIINEHGSLEKLIRKDSSRYYGMNHDLYRGLSKEYLFLDTELKVNDFWRHYKEDSTKITEYTVVSINSTRSINEKEYKDVIELEVKYFEKVENEYKLLQTALHWYARNVGEIYAVVPDSRIQFGNWDKVSLMRQ